MNVVNAIFSDGTEIVGTYIHPVWSVDRQDWIALGELQEYERVQTRSGPIHLLSLQQALPADVFNIEVDCHHVYEVGHAGVLVHNACAAHMIGRIGERHAESMLRNAGWDVLGGVTRGRNGVDLVAQKVIRGKLETLIVEVKANGGRLSALQGMGSAKYFDNVVSRLGDSSAAAKAVIDARAAGDRVRGILIRIKWDSGDFREIVNLW